MVMHILFVVGIIAAVVGWFFENAKRFPWIILRIAPEYVFAKRALDDLEKNPKIAVTRDHEAFETLLEKWPNLQNREVVQYIGRSPAYLSLGPQVKNDIQIIAYNDEQKEIESRWCFSEARLAVNRIVEGRVFKFGAFLFWLGVAVSVTAYVVSSLRPVTSPVKPC